MSLAQSRSSKFSLGEWLYTTPHAQVSFLLFAHILLWGLAGWALGYPGGVTDDMLETYTWGQELEWGYYKHPPFYSWITNAWFLYFPTTDWAYYLLSSVNGAVGLLGVWFLAGRYVEGWNRVLAVLLLDLMPLYTLLSFNFNANSISLAIWPWAIFAFLRSYEDKSFTWSIALGLLGASAVLSKYYAGVLLLSFFIVSFSSVSWRRYYFSSLPYIAFFVFVLCLLPHFGWLLDAAVTPINYLSGKATEFSRAFSKSSKVFASGIAFHFVIIAIFIFFRKSLGLKWKGVLHTFLRDEKKRTLALLAVLPFLATVVLGVVLSLKLSSRFVIPAFALSPLLLIVALHAKFDERVAKKVMIMAFGLVVVCIFAAPINGYLRINKKEPWEHSDPRVQLAEKMEHNWRSWTDKPLDIVAGTQSYSLATSYYFEDHPSHFTEFRYDYAPWVNEVGIRSSTFAAICATSDTDCLEAALTVGEFYEAGNRRTDEFAIANSAFGIEGQKINFKSFFYLPPTH